MTAALLEYIEDLEPGQSVKVGKAWDGSYYVVREHTVVGSLLGPVTRTIARADTFEEAYVAEPQPDRP